MLVACGWVRPSAISQPYRVELRYSLGKDPKVWVREPQIVATRGDEEVPHVYDRRTDPRPCLFYPNKREWRADKLLGTTVMPWLLLWLNFYEVWLATGSWLGGGVDHGASKRALA